MNCLKLQCLGHLECYYCCVLSRTGLLGRQLRIEACHSRVGEPDLRFSGSKIWRR